MALGKGIGVMGRGADLDPEALAAREKLAQQLYANSLAPQGDERSWTQGAARLAQSLMSGYEQAQVGKDKDAYQQKQQEGMAALLGGNGNVTPEIAATLPLNQQGYALQMMQSQRQNEAQRAEKIADRQSQFEMKKQERSLSPINKTQDEIYALQQDMLDSNIPPTAKKEAQERLAMLQGSLSAMSPARTTVNVDAGQKAEDAALKKRKEELEVAAVKKEELVSDVGLAADDKIFRLNSIDNLIAEGKLNNQNTSVPGQALNVIAASLNIPNDTASIGTFVKTANQELVDARQQMKGQGQISDKETAMLAATVLDPRATMEQVREYTAVAKQAYKRQKDMAKLQESWIKNNGSTTARNAKGQTFREAQSQLISARPLISLTEEKRRKEAAANAAAKGQGVLP